MNGRPGSVADDGECLLGNPELDGKRRAQCFAGGRAAGEQPGGLGARAKERSLTVRDRPALRPGLLHEWRGGAVQDEVEDVSILGKEIGRDRRLTLLDADAARVDEQFGARELGLDDRVVPGACAKLQVPRGAREVRDQRLGPMKVAVQHRDALKAGADQHGDDGARPSAGAEHDRIARPLALDPRKDRGETGADAIRVGVVPAQATVDPDEDVDRPAQPTVVRERVRQRGSLLLVRRGDQRAAERVVASDLSQRIGELMRPPLPSLDLERRPDIGQGGPKHALEGRLGQRVADDRKAGCRHLGQTWGRLVGMDSRGR